MSKTSSGRGRARPVSLMLYAAFLLLLLAVRPVAARIQDASPSPAPTVSPYDPPDDLAALSGTVLADGSSTVGPITGAVAREFARLAPSIDVRVNISGSSKGFDRFCAGETDLQDASRPINDDEAIGCAGAGVAYYVFEIAFDGIAVVVNPANDFVDCLNVADLARLWQPGSAIGTWRDLDPAFPEKTIALYGPGDQSGTWDYFTEKIVGEAGASRLDYVSSEDDDVLVDGVAGNPDGLGYFGYAYYERNRDRLKLVAVDGGDGCLEPSPFTIRTGSYQPLSRPLFIYVNAAGLQRPEVLEFLRFYLAEARRVVGDVGYVATLDAVYASGQAKLEDAVLGEVAADGPPTPDATASQ